MVLKLTVYFRNIISFSHKAKNSEIPIFRTFLAKFSSFAYVSLKIGYFELGHNYELPLMSRLRCWYLLWLCMEKGDPKEKYGTNNMYLGVSFSSTWEDMVQKKAW